MAVHLIDHPILQHQITLLRDKNTNMQQFRALVDNITLLLTFEITRDFELISKTVETPIQKTKGKILKKRSVVLVPILRAGLGMLYGALNLLPDASVAHIGLERDHETFKPRTYYHKLPPNLKSRYFIILDPMLATGGSMTRTLEFLVEHGADTSKIKIMCLIAAPEGISTIEKKHPNIPIYVAAIDEKLNDKAYIVPGLGDAGDRLFGTI